ncbi:MAG TPA: DoxX family membrane protein [Steroidobacteraceae bacterium]|nr:DoxX family membrane protein [Steroidobacteraceae bacterium]
MYARLVTVVRVMMGAEFLVNGLNWWVKLIGPYPSISDFAQHAPPADFVGAMIQTGVMFHLVKGTELLAGIALLTNRFVPLVLVAVFPVTVPVFIVDVILIHHLRGFFMGAGAMLMNTFLLFSYLHCYRPMLQPRAIPDARDPQGASIPAPLMLVYGAVAAAFGTVILTWVAVMIFQYAAR